MIKLQIIIILILCSFSFVKADEIDDFEIEGISLGDNLFDHLSKKKFIEWKEYRYYYSNSKYVKTPCIYPSDQYDVVGCTYKEAKDGNHKILGINGTIKFDKNISKCFLKKDKIVNEFKKILKNTSVNDQGTYEHDYDKTGESKQTVVDFNFRNGGYIRVVCNDWSNKITNEIGWTDELLVVISSKELVDFINSDENI